MPAAPAIAQLAFGLQLMRTPGRDSSGLLKRLDAWQRRVFDN
jgi:hypothetical protein